MGVKVGAGVKGVGPGGVGDSSRLQLLIGLAHDSGVLRISRSSPDSAGGVVTGLLVKLSSGDIPLVPLSILGRGSSMDLSHWMSALICGDRVGGLIEGCPIIRSPSSNIRAGSRRLLRMIIRDMSGLAIGRVGLSIGLDRSRVIALVPNKASVGLMIAPNP